MLSWAKVVVNLRISGPYTRTSPHRNVGDFQSLKFELNSTLEFATNPRAVALVCLYMSLPLEKVNQLKSHCLEAVSFLLVEVLLNQRETSAHPRGTQPSLFLKRKSQHCGVLLDSALIT